ncbi:ATP-dependent DNA ligase [Hydrogenophaga sp. Root209]|uniref:ATP-dependent DNA ligase n=1 Tax=unclassified Hydrogenophaga TaxID=2610897 RepID=UPI0006FFB367|nr:ATP-dependent DNA ligase [Hydrogenophaga sp. Root209]KRB99697.1 ATP-dependent DNA ligase [Hydrogenophaga sp. Root209]
MKRFADLFAELDATTATSAKVTALRRYLSAVDDADAAWAVYFLSGGKPRQLIKTAQLRALAQEASGLPEWLFEASYQTVGDLAETIALVLPAPEGSEGLVASLSDWMEQRLLPLRGQGEDIVAMAVRAWWRELDMTGRFLLVKLVSGGFRVGVSKLLVQRAIAQHAGLDAKQVAARMMGFTDSKRLPTAAMYRALIAPAGEAGGEHAAREPSQPYPFFLANPLGMDAGDDLLSLEVASSDIAQAMQARLGPAIDWQAEWKFDGVRGQIVKRAGRVWVWSRGEELMSERFPELQALAQRWPDGTVVDGEILVWDEGDGVSALPGSDRLGRPAPFALLQQRIARKTLNAKVLADAPVSFMAYDLLEADAQDLRAQPQTERRARLETLARGLNAVLGPRLWLSPGIAASDWPTLAEQRSKARELGVEGLMLKHRRSTYGTGRQKRWTGPGTNTEDGVVAWWKWKIDPLSIDGVLIYAQAGHGRRASVYTDYTFAVWNRLPASAEEAQAVVDAIARREPAVPGALQLVAFTKAYSGLTDEEFKSVDAVIRQQTLEKFGPVRSVRPTLVFELAFEGIARSTRHKSGVALRFPRMQRIRYDKPLHEASTLQELEALLGDSPSR